MTRAVAALLTGITAGYRTHRLLTRRRPPAWWHDPDQALQHWTATHPRSHP